MCLDFCGCCGPIRKAWTLLVVFTVCGYVGKGVYVFGGKPDVNLSHELSKSEFYTPDGYFWVFGFLFTIILLGLAALLKGSTNCVWVRLKMYGVGVIGFVCPSCLGYDEYIRLRSTHLRNKVERKMEDLTVDDLRLYKGEP
jgi:hypothetical protein